MPSEEPRTELEARIIAAGDDPWGAQVEVEPEQPALGPNDVRLSTGEVVTLRETTGLDDELSEKLLSRMGYSTSGMGGVSFGRAMMLLAIESIGGRPVLRPRTKRDLDDLLRRFRTRDLVQLSRKYGEINGLGDDNDESFRPDLV